MQRIRAALDERRGARLLKVSAAKVSGVRRTMRPGLIFASLILSAGHGRTHRTKGGLKMPLLRVWLEGEDDPEVDRLLVHLRTTDDGEPVRDEAVLGLCGDFDDEDNRYPFVLMPDGTLDFGAYLKKQQKKILALSLG